MSNVIRLQRNEGGDDRDILWSRHHGCKSAPELRAALGDQDADILMFPVGLAGYEMPSNVPFQVMAANACRVCGSLCAIWAEWIAPKIWVPG